MDIANWIQVFDEAVCISHAANILGKAIESAGALEYVDDNSAEG